MIESVGSACTGCGACVSSCPKSCISMEERELGHAYPVVDAGACIHCGVCQRVCHALKPFEQGAFEGRSFAVQAIDERILADSSSGGAFSLLAEEMLGKGGVVYGSGWSRGKGAVHTRAASPRELPALRRSKYVHSDTTGIFELVRDDLAAEVEVLFVGTPCQVAALKAFLSRDPKNLVTVDLVCHGVPSSAFFEEYLRWFEDRAGKPLVKYNSRDKSAAGWSYRSTTRTFSRSTKTPRSGSAATHAPTPGRSASETSRSGTFGEPSGCISASTSTRVSRLRLPARRRGFACSNAHARAAPSSKRFGSRTPRARTPT